LFWQCRLLQGCCFIVESFNCKLVYGFPFQLNLDSVVDIMGSGFSSHKTDVRPETKLSVISNSIPAEENREDSQDEDEIQIKKHNAYVVMCSACYIPLMTIPVIMFGPSFLLKCWVNGAYYTIDRIFRFCNMNDLFQLSLVTL